MELRHELLSNVDAKELDTSWNQVSDLENIENHREEAAF